MRLISLTVYVLAPAVVCLMTLALPVANHMMALYVSSYFIGVVLERWLSAGE